MNGIPGGTTTTTVVQVTNLSSSVSSEQMAALFGFLGDIEELRLYPPDNAPVAFSSRVCYIKYREPSSVGVAQHLTNTVFIDRALIVVPCAEGKIPEEAKALSLLAPSAPPPPAVTPGAGLLPNPTLSPVHNAGIQQLNRAELSLSVVSRPPAELSPSLSAQPPLMGNVDPSKINEIRRTVYVGNLNSQTTTADQLLEFFKQVGDVKFVRMAGDETQPTRFAFVEFVDQNSVSRALTFNGVMFGDRPLKINHSNNAIVKPPELTAQAAAKELESVMKRVREAQSTIAAAIEPGEEEEVEEKKRSSSRSRRPRRSRSRSKTNRKRSRSRHRTKPAQVALPRGSDARGVHKRRSRSKEPRRSSSHSRGHRKRSRERSRTPKKNARSPSPRRVKKGSRRTEHSRDRKEHSPPRKRSHKDPQRISRARPVKIQKEYERKEKEDYESDKEGSGTASEDMASPCTQQNGS
ncbi:hypothetical protein NHX12_027668 [Muraenolepis orangiensis]|uniref:Splicing regulatory glutamine/lysine-rich protein 1 n=1 Tax=Muraenolepis orangiensis TaxID=630683 RepID=A0A9Q0IPG4_9TELE|nr:hypothetical protein NHX12_027668 [Muraenolepis orangiensis]